MRNSRLQYWPVWMRGKFWQPWLPAGLALLLVAGLLGLQLLQPLEQVAYQWLFQTRGALAWDDRVVLVAIDDASLRQLGQFPWSRDRYTQLLDVLQTAPPNVVALDLLLVESNPADQLLAEAMRTHHQVVLASGGSIDQSQLEPNARLRSAAIAQGHVWQTPDRDGLVRQVVANVGGLPSLSQASLQAYGLFGAVPPGTNDQTLWPNWIGPIAQIPQYAFIDVLNGKVNPTAFQGKIILVGVTAAGLNPLVTPFDAESPASGVHLQATLVQNLLQQNLLHPLSGIGVGGLLLVSQMVWLKLLRRWPIAIQLGASGLLMVAWWLICAVALRWHYLLPVVLPIVLWLSTAVLHWIVTNIQLEAKNRQLSYLANIDELTQVANRRAFEQYLQQEWQRSRREQQPISLILCDVDFFKQFNDCYGHLIGDRALHQVAQALVASTKRPTDLVARYGGEEFAVILPNTDAAGVQQMTARILSEMRSQLIPHAASAVSHYLTVSLGSVTVVPEGAIDWHNLIDGADRGLYRAKAQGRDAACHATLAPSSIQH
jgi:adenylate cyclase